MCNVRVHYLVFLEERNNLPVSLVDSLNGWRRLQWATEVECLSRIKPLDSQDLLGIVHYLI